MSETLEPSTPLKVHRIASYTSQKTDDARELCEPQNLSEVARITRRVFHEAIAKRVVGERYGRKESHHRHLSDMAMLMVPRLRSGKYLNLIRDSDVGKIGGFTQTADLIKEKLWHGVADLVERVIVAKRARDGGMKISIRGRRVVDNYHPNRLRKRPETTDPSH